MPSKRRNNGRSKKNRGHTVAISCSNCTRMVPKDKAIKRYNVRDMVDASSRRDLKEASVYEHFQVPKIYIKQAYCVSCAIHARIVRVRSVADRKIRVAPSRVNRDAKGQSVQQQGQKKEE